MDHSHKLNAILNDKFNDSAESGKLSPGERYASETIIANVSSFHLNLIMLSCSITRQT